MGITNSIELVDNGGYRVAVVGAGAAGVATTIQLARQAARRRVPLTVLLIDPVEHEGRGIAYATPDPRHRLNVRADRMSLSGDDPLDFVRWLHDTAGEPVEPGDFVPRARFGEYLADRLRETTRATGVRCRQVRDRVVGVRTNTGVTLRLAGGSTVDADAAVLAIGVQPPACDWAPEDLRASARFVANPWAPGAMTAVRDTGDVLLVGTGLTMIDWALSLARPGRVVHAVSRHGRLPMAHATQAGTASVVPRFEPARLRSLCAVRREIFRQVRLADGNWQPVLDGLRPHTAALWAGMPVADQRLFLERDRRIWDVHRHRMPAVVSAEVQELLRHGRLVVHAGEVSDVVPGSRGLRVRLSGAEVVSVGAVVNCTGPRDDIRQADDPFVDDLLTSGCARPGPFGLGFDTAPDGQMLPADGRPSAPLWTIGAPRRGNLWESTAFPEIREQAVRVAQSALPVATTRRRPRDLYGLPLSTTGAAAEAYRSGMLRILGFRVGAEEAMTAAVAADPGFALGHAVSAILRHEAGNHEQARVSLTAAEAAVRQRGDERERGFVAAAAGVLAADAAALLRHIDAFPRDALALSVAVPTIAFSGVIAGEQGWNLVERLRPVFGDDWWYLGQLAFVRQEQGRWQEAAALAERALAVRPDSGHAVHANTHVHYETGEHDAGRAWLDGWLAAQGDDAKHSCHFSWHAALHELALGDVEAVRRRYAAELAPPMVSGPRALVDSAALLWRCAMTGTWPKPLPIQQVLDASPAEWLRRPPTAFAALHAAMALAAADDIGGLRRLTEYASAHPAVEFSQMAAPLCRGLAAVVEGKWDLAENSLRPLLSSVRRFGGSQAQCEVVEDTVIHVLMSAGRNEDAARLLSVRLDRRSSVLDRNRLDLTRK